MKSLIDSSIDYTQQRIRGWPLVATFISVGAFFPAYLQIFGMSKDYFFYASFFHLLRFEGLDAFTVSRFEPGFVVVSSLLAKMFSSDTVVYGIFVSILMFFKEAAICRISKSVFIAIVATIFYLVRYFPLHELTQLRVAVSTAFLIWALIFFQAGKRFQGLITCIAAITFQMSSAVAMPALFFRPTKRRNVAWAGLSVFVAIFSFAAIVTAYLASKIGVVAQYELSGFGDDPMNPFSVTMLLDAVMIIVSFIMWNRLSLLMKRIIFLEMIGMAIFFGMIDYRVMAFRFRELYSVFWVFFVAEGLSLRTVRIPTAGFVVASIGVYLYIYITGGYFSR